MTEANQRHRDFAPSASLDALEQRAALLRRLRNFFHDRGFMEVETPLLSSEVIPELHIEPIAIHSARRGKMVGSPSRPQPLSDPQDLFSQMWLQASPELHMKRLMAFGAEAIFQVTRSFRAGERGQLHNPEFTIVEWYRRGDDMTAGIDLLDTLLQTTLGTPPALRTTYASAFLRQFNLCPHSCSLQDLADTCESGRVPVPDGMDREDRDEWLNLLLAMWIEPELGRDRPEILYHYPASQSSLARITTSPNGYDVAERFELYYRGIELANGFHELADVGEQRRRFNEVNAARAADGRPRLPLPEQLLAALNHSLPDCTGCALGFDRLAMLAIGATSIADVMAFLPERDMIK